MIFALLTALALSVAGQSTEEEDVFRFLYDGDRARRAALAVPGRFGPGLWTGLAPFVREVAPIGARAAQTAAPPSVIEELWATVTVLSSPDLAGRAPMSKGSEWARRYIVGQYRRHGLEPAGKDGSFVEPVKQRLTGRTIGHNVVGRIVGARAPEECVYVEAHYDHWGHAGGRHQPGANDNASGVAVMLELARAVAVSKPDRTVVFLAADYEEGALFPMLGGIKGSRAHTRRPACAADKIKGAFVMDMMGGRFIQGLDGHLFLLGSESSAATYELAGRAAAAAAAPTRRLGVYAIEPMGPRIPRGDYAAFRDIKAPFIFATSGIPAFYHTPQDTIDKIDFAFMAEALRTSLTLVLGMASADFATAYADPSGVVDWESERTVGLEMLEKITPHQTGPAREGLERLSERLRSAASPGDIKDAVRDLTLTVMKLNKAVKLGEHLFRTHGDR